MIFCKNPKYEVTIFQLLVTDYLQFAEQQTQNIFFSVVLPLQLQKDKEKKNNSKRCVAVKTYEHHNTCNIAPKNIKMMEQ